MSSQEAASASAAPMADLLDLDPCSAPASTSSTAPPPPPPPADLDPFAVLASAPSTAAAAAPPPPPPPAELDAVSAPASSSAAPPPPPPAALKVAEPQALKVADDLLSLGTADDVKPPDFQPVSPTRTTTPVLVPVLEGSESQEVEREEADGKANARKVPKWLGGLGSNVAKLGSNTKKAFMSEARLVVQDVRSVAGTVKEGVKITAEDTKALAKSLRKKDGQEAGPSEAGACAEDADHVPADSDAAGRVSTETTADAAEGSTEATQAASEGQPSETPAEQEPTGEEQLESPAQEAGQHSGRPLKNLVKGISGKVSGKAEAWKPVWHDLQEASKEVVKDIRTSTRQGLQAARDRSGKTGEAGMTEEEQQIQQPTSPPGEESQQQQRGPLRYLRQASGNVREGIVQAYNRSAAAGDTQHAQAAFWNLPSARANYVQWTVEEQPQGFKKLAGRFDEFVTRMDEDVSEKIGKWGDKLDEDGRSLVRKWAQRKEKVSEDAVQLARNVSGKVASPTRRRSRGQGSTPNGGDDIFEIGSEEGNDGDWARMSSEEDAREETSFWTRTGMSTEAPDAEDGAQRTSEPSPPQAPLQGGDLLDMSAPAPAQAASGDLLSLDSKAPESSALSATPVTENAPPTAKAVSDELEDIFGEEAPSAAEEASAPATVESAAPAPQAAAATAAAPEDDMLSFLDDELEKALADLK